MLDINTSAIFDSFMLATILAVLVERSLALFFENKFVGRIIKGKALKDLIAFCLCFAICKLWSIDIISLMVSSDKPQTLGYILTASAIAGGSKASIKLFQDIIGVGKMKKEAENETNK